MMISEYANLSILLLMYKSTLPLLAPSEESCLKVASGAYSLHNVKEHAERRKADIANKELGA